MTFRFRTQATHSPLRNPHPKPGSENLSASVDNLNPARKQRFGLSLSAARANPEAETLEPTPLPDRSPTDLMPEVGSNSLARTHPPTASTSLFGWPGDRPGRLAKLPARAPFDRLKFWTVEHELTHRLKPYQATDVSLMFRQASWGTILYWSQLFGDPDPQPVSQEWIDRLHSIKSGAELTEEEAREFYGADA